jgi:hypothetical protein
VNPIINILGRLGLFKEDLDYHVVRASMVIVYFFFAYQKWFEYEAQVLPRSDFFMAGQRFSFQVRIAASSRSRRAIDSLPDPTAARACLLAVARREHARLYQREPFETVDIAHIVVVDDPALASQADEDHSDARAAIVALHSLSRSCECGYM